MEIDQKDLSITTYCMGSKTEMKIVHTPTGTIIEGKDVSIYRLRKKLIEELKRKLTNDY